MHITVKSKKRLGGSKIAGRLATKSARSSAQLALKVPGFQACVAGKVENRFSTFFRRLYASLSDLSRAGQRILGGALNESMVPLCGLSEAVEVELSTSTPNIDS